MSESSTEQLIAQARDVSQVYLSEKRPFTADLLDALADRLASHQAVLFSDDAAAIGRAALAMTRAANRGWALHLSRVPPALFEGGELKKFNGGYWCGVDDEHGCRTGGAIEATLEEAVAAAVAQAEQCRADQDRRRVEQLAAETTAATQGDAP
jgi:hypothetical protein